MFHLPWWPLPISSYAFPYSVCNLYLSSDSFPWKNRPVSVFPVLHKFALSASCLSSFHPASLWSPSLLNALFTFMVGMILSVTQAYNLSATSNLGFILAPHNQAVFTSFCITSLSSLSYLSPFLLAHNAVLSHLYSFEHHCKHCFLSPLLWPHCSSLCIYPLALSSLSHQTSTTCLRAQSPLELISIASVTSPSLSRGHLLPLVDPWCQPSSIIISDSSHPSHWIGVPISKHKTTSWSYFKSPLETLLCCDANKTFDNGLAAGVLSLLPVMLINTVALFPCTPPYISIHLLPLVLCSNCKLLGPGIVLLFCDYAVLSTIGSP